MTVPFGGPALGRDDDLTREPPGASLFARIEGLLGEEDALLLIPARERTEDQHDRLRAIGDELDRIWERLRERAERLEERGAER
jgi:hypothetical protein